MTETPKLTDAEHAAAIYAANDALADAMAAAAEAGLQIDADARFCTFVTGPDRPLIEITVARPILPPEGNVP